MIPITRQRRELLIIRHFENMPQKLCRERIIIPPAHAVKGRERFTPRRG